MRTVSEISLNADQQGLMCSIINRFGGGQHPIADGNSLNYFTIDYVKKILNGKKFLKAKENLSQKGKEILETITGLL